MCPLPSMQPQREVQCPNTWLWVCLAPPASSSPAQPHPALHHHLSSPGHQHMDRLSLSHGHMWAPNYTSFNRIKSMVISKSLQVIVSQFTETCEKLISHTNSWSTEKTLSKPTAEIGLMPTLQHAVHCVQK